MTVLLKSNWEVRQDEGWHREDQHGENRERAAGSHSMADPQLIRDQERIDLGQCLAYHEGESAKDVAEDTKRCHKCVAR